VALEEDGPRWKLRLTPRHAPLSKAIAHIVLEGLRDELERMEVLDGEGARTVTHLDQVQTNRRFAAAELATLFEEGRPLPLPDHGR
jgi:hypothetical protein